MGGINSLSGLNNVSVDFRPTIAANVQNEAIEHAKKLKLDGKVFGEAQWKDHRNLRWMTTIQFKKPKAA